MMIIYLQTKFFFFIRCSLEKDAKGEKTWERKLRFLWRPESIRKVDKPGICRKYANQQFPVAAFDPVFNVSCCQFRVNFIFSVFLLATSLPSFCLLLCHSLSFPSLGLFFFYLLFSLSFSFSLSVKNGSDQWITNVTHLQLIINHI